MSQPNKPYAGYQQATSYSAFIDRNIIAASVLHQDTIVRDGVFANSDVIQGVDFWVTMTGGWTISVAHGQCMVAGYTVVVPGDNSLTLDPATSVARRDLIVVRVYDTEQGDAKTDCTVEIIKGTTTADPTIPVRCLVVDQIDIPANAVNLTQAMSTDRRVWTTSHGGVMRVIGAYGSTTKVPPGTMAFDPQKDAYYRRGASQFDTYLSPLKVVPYWAPLAGNLPGDQRDMRMICGVGVATTNGGGVININVPFTQIMAIAGAFNADQYTGASAPWMPNVYQPQTSVSTLTITVLNRNGDIVANTAVRVGWWAVGC